MKKYILKNNVSIFCYKVLYIIQSRANWWCASHSCLIEDVLFLTHLLLFSFKLRLNSLNWFPCSLHVFDWLLCICYGIFWPHLWLYLCDQVLHRSVWAPCCRTHPTMIIAVVSAEVCSQRLQPHQAGYFPVSWSFC